MNGSIQNASNQSMNDDSDESFVVLSPSLAPDNMENIMSFNSSVVQSLNTMTQIPDTQMQVIIYSYIPIHFYGSIILLFILFLTIAKVANYCTTELILL